MPQLSPKLRELLALRTLLRTGSASETARVLGVSQPAISKSLRQLETSLGFTLFDRTGGRLRLTPEAELLIPAVDNVLTSVSALSAAGQSIRDERIGQVTVGALPTLAHVFLPAAIQAVTQRHPRMRISLQILPTRQIIDAVTRGALDLGLVHDLSDEPLLRTEDLGASAMCAVVPRGHPLHDAREIRARDLRGLPLVSFAEQSPIGQQIAAAFRQARESFAPTIEVSASTALCTTAAHCGIVGIVEQYVLSLGWWPSLRAVPLTPAIPLRPRILSTRNRPITSAASFFCAEYRKVVAGLLPAPKRSRLRRPVTQPV